MRGQIARTADFRGGVDFRGPSRLTVQDLGYDDDPGPRRLLYAQNVTCDANGIVRRRAGVTTSSAFSSRAYTSFQFLPSMGVYIGGAPNSSEIIAGFPGFPTSSQWSIKPAGSGIATRMRWVEGPIQDGMGPAWGLNPGSVPSGIAWDGSLSVGVQWTVANGANTNWTYLSSLPAGAFMEHFQGRIFIAGVGGDLHAVFWSDTQVGVGARPRNWPTQNVVRLEPNSGSVITGICPSGSNLLVFKSNRVFSIYDTESGANRTISSSIGAIPGSIAAGQSGEVYFLSPQAGPCVCDGRSVRRIGDAVRSIIPTSLADSSTGRLAGVVFDNHYLLGEGALINGTYYMLDYDIANDSWWLHTVPARVLTTYQTTTTTELWGIGSTVVGSPLQSGPVYKFFNSPYGSDGSVGTGAAIPAIAFRGEVILPWEDYGASHLRKRLRRIRITGKGGLDVELARDYALTPRETLVNNGLSTQTTTGMLDIPVNGRVARAFSLRITGDTAISADQNWQINEIVTAVTMRKD